MIHEYFDACFSRLTSGKISSFLSGCFGLAVSFLVGLGIGFYEAYTADSDSKINTKSNDDLH